MKQNKPSFSLPKRAVSVILAGMLLCSSLIVGLPVMAEDSGRAADPGTMADWESSFGPNVEDTSNVGRIVTDKTVTDGDVTLDPSGLTISRSEEENFLVSLSAVSSNKSIVGQSTIPVDVMLVLDVSGSMSNSQSVGAMVSATNQSIQTLLDLNIRNRVGVILYSGNSSFGDSATSTATRLLELNRYESASGRFLSYNDNGGGESVSVASGLQYEDGGNVTGVSKRVTGGTYIQNGIYQAMEELCAVTDTDVDGTKRIPIIVLMSDGAPTSGTNSYTNVGTSNIGNGGGTSAALGFLSQLTGAYARNQIETHYGRDSLIYTLGLGLNSLGENDRNIARAVLDPTQSTQSIRSYWTTYQGLGTGRTMNVTHNGNSYAVAKTAGVSDRYYVDEYFSANNAADLNRAFADIVAEIIIQSRYYPTDTTANTPHLSGYLSFEDEIGEYMEVKRVNGLVYQDTLFTGAGFAKMVDSHTNGRGELDMDTADIATLVDSIATRLSISEEAAQQLLQAAVDEGDLYYHSDQDFGNDIVWYGDAAGNYLQIRQDGQEAPEQAVYLNHSYTYDGTSVGTVYGENIMHITVRVQTELSTGRQTVLLKVPAALVPMVQYNVTIDTDDLETAQNAAVERVEAYPMRLFYEVGVSSGITADNLAEAIRADYPFVEGDTYTFYTNRWNEIQKTAGTQVNFYPSQENEFYFYPSHTVIYDEQNQPLKTRPTAGGTYYYHHFIFGTDGSITEQHDAIHPEALAYAARNDDTGNWYIPKGTSKFTNSQYTTAKTQNTTQTAPNALSPSVVVDNEQQSVYVSVGLGNNGYAQLTQTHRSLKIQKTVNGAYADPDQAFTFTVTLLDSTGTALTGSYPYTGSKTGSISSGGTVSLKGGESIEITDLPVGCRYSVTETPVPGYTAAQDTISGVISAGSTAAAEAGFVNTYTLQESSLDGSAYLSGTKTLNGRAWQEGDRFAFTLQAGNPATQAAVADGDVVLPAATTVEAIYGNPDFAFGNITFKKPGEYVFTIRESIPSGDTNGIQYDTAVTTITVTVTNNGDGTMLVAVPTYAGDLDFVNEYHPQPVSRAVSGTKTLSGKPLEADAFTFVLSAVTQGAPMPAQTSVKNNAAGGFAFPPVSFTTAGTYTYQVVEQNDQHTGYSYDGSVYLVTFEIGDDGKGNLFVQSQTITRDAAPADGILFENRYQALPATLSGALHGVKRVNVNAGDYTLKENDFTFEISRLTADAPLPATTAVKNDGQGNFQFGDITYTAAGTYEYQVRESSQTPIPGMSYDGRVYHVTVVVEDVAGQLTITGVTRESAEGQTDSMDFVNTYDPQDVSYAISGRKELQGRNQTAGEFTFELWENDTLLQTVKNTADGSFAFASISYSQEGTHRYTVKEKPGTDDTIAYDTRTYTVTVTVEDVNGELQAQADVLPAQIVFQNTYTPHPVTLTGNTALGGQKVLNGRTLKAGEFSFVLKDGQGNKVDTAANRADGSFAFADLTFTEEGTWLYTISEEKGSLGGISYDDTVYTVSIEVTDEGGQLKADVAYTPETQQGQAVFTNTYSPERASVTLGAGKFLNEGLPEKDAFTFQLKQEGKVISEKGNDAGGVILFDTLTYEKAGVYVYEISEVAGNTPGMTYDKTVYTATVTVTDDAEGHLVPVVSYAIGEEIRDGAVFYNQYEAESSDALYLEARKVLSGRSLREGEFTFQLKDSIGEVLSEAGNRADGSVVFDPLTFDQEGVYTYTMAEVSGRLPGVTYDRTVYTLQVEVKDVGGKLTAAVKYPNDTIPVFRNVYRTTPPPYEPDPDPKPEPEPEPEEPQPDPPVIEVEIPPRTGDNSQLALWVVLAGLSLAGLTATGIAIYKQRKNHIS